MIYVKYCGARGFRTYSPFVTTYVITSQSNHISIDLLDFQILTKIWYFVFSLLLQILMSVCLVLARMEGSVWTASTDTPVYAPQGLLASTVNSVRYIFVYKILCHFCLYLPFYYYRVSQKKVYSSFLGKRWSKCLLKLTSFTLCNAPTLLYHLTKF